MSTSNPATEPPTSDHTNVFSAAIQNFKTLMGINGQDLLVGTPFASKLDDLKSTRAVLNMLRSQMPVFDEFRKGNKILMTWLESIVDILFMLQKKLGESPDAVSFEGFIRSASRY